MLTKTIAVLDPTSKSRVKEISMVPRLHDLNGKAIDFLWNSKPNGDILLLRIKERLSQRFSFARTGWHQKPHSGVPLKATTIEELTLTSDLVINAIGD